MLFILLRIVFQTAFAQLLRYGQVRSGRVLVVALVNYAFATAVCFTVAAVAGTLSVSRVTLWTGLAGGVGYLVSLLLVLPAMRSSGVAISVATLQVAQLLPVAYSIAFFGERPSIAQVFGLILAMTALVVLSLTTSAPTAATGVRFSPILLPLFLVTGSSGVAMKTFQEFGPPAEQLTFNAILFAAATVSNIVAVAWARNPEPKAVPTAPVRVAVTIGLLMGAANSGQLICLMVALAREPAILVFPVASALSLVANALVSIYLWQEWLRPAGWFGLALALIATVLLNIHPSGGESARESRSAIHLRRTDLRSTTPCTQSASISAGRIFGAASSTTAGRFVTISAVRVRTRSPMSSP